MNESIDIAYQQAVDLLQQLIAIPSFSRQEEQTAQVLEDFLTAQGLKPARVGNNVLALNRQYDPAKPTILLNSHHDTVRPNQQYSKDPFVPTIEGGRLYGLGSNDAGGCLVSLTAAFLYFADQPGLANNIILALTAEEEISGSGGIELALTQLPKIDYAIVGEPTLLQMAVAERGLMVLDCISHGKAGHAARNEGDNAIYKALRDIEWFRTYQFDKVSELLGPCKLNVTSIYTDNKAHNVVPDQCHFVVDVRVNELYTFEEVIACIREQVSCSVTPRSTRLRSTAIVLDHPLVQAGTALGKTYYGSPTTSDKALMPFPSLKIGPGDSARSHTADEYIFLDEIREGVNLYIQLLKRLS